MQSRSFPVANLNPLRVPCVSYDCALAFQLERSNSLDNNTERDQVLARSLLTVLYIVGCVEILGIGRGTPFLRCLVLVILPCASFN